MQKLERRVGKLDTPPETTLLSSTNHSPSSYPFILHDQIKFKIFFSTNTNRKEAAATVVIPVVVNSMKRHSEDVNVQDRGYAALANLAFNDNKRGLIINVAGIFIHDCQTLLR
mmetsp:Transcript_19018/g.28913  ORF Transcript_19018/g.28913 Transcript_19018/m.28913 type:complete len:113 (+) Transcript_19018:719-1057(+)